MTIQTVAAMTGVMLFPLTMVYAGLMDVMTMKIRNTIVLALGLGWLLLAPLAGMPLVDLGWSLGVALLVFLLAFFCFARGWIGGGDAKLAAVTALWFRPEEALLYFTYASLLGGVLTLGLLQLRARLLPASLTGIPWIAQLHAPKAGVPYGAAMAPAALIVFPQTAWLAQAVG